MYERMLCIVPMVGEGTAEDPRRPQFAPTEKQLEITRTIVLESGDEIPGKGIIAFGYQESDDGKFAIVEFVARSRSAFREITESKDQRIQIISRKRKSKQERSVLQTELRKYKKDFDLSKLTVAVQ